MILLKGVEIDILEDGSLDLPDTACRMAKEVLISINSDAHSHLQFDNLRCGVSQARRDWLEANDVLNTRTFHQLRPLSDAIMGL